MAGTAHTGQFVDEVRLTAETRIHCGGHDACGGSERDLARHLLQMGNRGEALA